MIVRAKRVAVRDEHAFAIELDDYRVRDQPRAGLVAELAAEQEVAVAVDHEAGDAALGQLADRTDDLRLLRVRVVVADPDFEEIAEDVERVGAGHVLAEESEELLG